MPDRALRCEAFLVEIVIQVLLSARTQSTAETDIRDRPKKLQPTLLRADPCETHSESRTELRDDTRRYDTVTLSSLLVLTISVTFSARENTLRNSDMTPIKGS
jgi:hypothetical protein